ncbi:MAG: hypothetical protein ACK4G3_05935 [bacterium]
MARHSPPTVTPFSIIWYLSLFIVCWWLGMLLARLFIDWIGYPYPPA